MTANGSFERTLESWLATEAPVSAPIGLHDDAMARAGLSRPRPGWVAALRGETFGRTQRISAPIGRFILLVVVVGSVLACLAFALPGGPFHDTRAPAVPADRFLRPFEYVIPAGSTLERTVESARLYAFTEGSGEIYPRDPDGAFLPGVRGITVAVADGAVTHECQGQDMGSRRVPVRTEPQAFLEDLRTLAGVGLGEPTPTTIDGRSGLTVDVLSSKAGCEFADFHVLGSGLGSGYILMTIPARLWLVSVDGSTVVVQTWAGTEDDLAAWLPVASEFIDSIHFIPQR